MSPPPVSPPKVIIYHIEGRRCERVAWLMEELALPYDLVFKAGDLAGSMALVRAAHPMAMAPVVEIDGTVMVESGAILEYVVTKYADGRLWVPVTSEDYANHLMFMHYAEGAAAPRITQDYILRTIESDALSPLAKAQVGRSQRVLEMAEAHLARHRYFGGRSFTTADIMMQFPLRLTKTWGVDWSLYPHIGPWFEAVEARPAFQAMMARAQPNGPPPGGGLTAPLLADVGKARG
jgi:glutathione S-transferase